jgi:hypothetical protein
VAPFLEFVFSNVATRPGPLRLRETSLVVHLLLLLAQYGVPREIVGKGKQAVEDYGRETEYEAKTRRPMRKDRQIRKQTERLALRIWHELLSYIEGAITPKAALAFLRKHEGTHFADSLDIDAALRLVETFELPPGTSRVLGRPHLVSARSRAFGQENPRLQNNLSECIYAAYHALRRSKVTRVSHLVAEALTRAEVRDAAKGKPPEWTYTEVHDRLKVYERSFQGAFLKGRGQQTVATNRIELERRRIEIANKWIRSFRPL